VRTLFLVIMLAALAAQPLRGQTPNAGERPATPGAAVDDEAVVAALLLDLRALEDESKELLKPVDAAAAKAEVAGAAWPLDRAWAKSLLREALDLTFPAEVDRVKLRARPLGAPLSPPTPEDAARGLVRQRIFKIAGGEKEFARELAEVSARELGRGEETEGYARMASAAARAGRVEEAGEYILRAAGADPTLINVAGPFNEIAARDRAAADRLFIRYVESLRATPLLAFEERGGAAMRLSLGLAWMLRPADSPFAARGESAPAPPAGREAVRAYLRFVFDLSNRLEQARPGGSRAARGMLLSAWPFLVEHAPDLSAQFHALEQASRGADARAPELLSLEQIAEKYGRRYEKQVELALKSKDQSDLELLINRAKSRGDFAVARELLDVMKDERLKAQLGEVVDAEEAIHLTRRGDVVGAERLARRLVTPNLILRAHPPLVRLLVRNGDTAGAASLTDEAVKSLRVAAESGSGDDSYIPGALAPVAGSLRVFKQSRALLAFSELALAVRPAGAQLALDALDELVRAANKGRITSENGSPNFNADVFAELAGDDEGRARAAAARLEDRLQRIAALAAVHRARAAALAKRQRADGAGDGRR
jgi:hypothetical protein